MRHRAAALVALILPAVALAAPRPQVELACTAHGMGPQLDCTVRVARDGKPLDGLQVMLGATMPSMPMAHSVRPAVAKPTGKAGEYRGTLGLEMLGAWAVQVDLAGAVRDRVVRTLDVGECEGDQRCPVPPATAPNPKKP